MLPAQTTPSPPTPLDRQPAPGPLRRHPVAQPKDYLDPLVYPQTSYLTAQGIAQSRVDKPASRPIAASHSTSHHARLASPRRIIWIFSTKRSKNSKRRTPNEYLPPRRSSRRIPRGGRPMNTFLPNEAVEDFQETDAQDTSLNSVGVDHNVWSAPRAVPVGTATWRVGIRAGGAGSDRPHTLPTTSLLLPVQAALYGPHGYVGRRHRFGNAVEGEARCLLQGYFTSYVHSWA